MILDKADDDMKSRHVNIVILGIWFAFCPNSAQLIDATSQIDKTLTSADLPEDYHATTVPTKLEVVTSEKQTVSEQNNVQLPENEQKIQKTKKKIKVNEKQSTVYDKFDKESATRLDIVKPNDNVEEKVTLNVDENEHGRSFDSLVDRSNYKTKFILRPKVTRGDESSTIVATYSTSMSRKNISYDLDEHLETNRNPVQNTIRFDKEDYYGPTGQSDWVPIVSEKNPPRQPVKTYKVPYVTEIRENIYQSITEVNNQEIPSPTEGFNIRLPSSTKEDYVNSLIKSQQTGGFLPVFSTQQNQFIPLSTTEIPLNKTEDNNVYEVTTEQPKLKTRGNVKFHSNKTRWEIKKNNLDVLKKNPHFNTVPLDMELPPTSVSWSLTTLVASETSRFTRKPLNETKNDNVAQETAVPEDETNKITKRNYTSINAIIRDKDSGNLTKLDSNETKPNLNESFHKKFLSVEIFNESKSDVKRTTQGKENEAIVEVNSNVELRPALNKTEVSTVSDMRTTEDYEEIDTTVNIELMKITTDKTSSENISSLFNVVTETSSTPILQTVRTTRIKQNIPFTPTTERVPILVSTDGVRMPTNDRHFTTMEPPNLTLLTTDDIITTTVEPTKLTMNTSITTTTTPEIMISISVEPTTTKAFPTTEDVMTSPIASSPETIRPKIPLTTTERISSKYLTTNIPLTTDQATTSLPSSTFTQATDITEETLTKVTNHDFPKIPFHETTADNDSDVESDDSLLTTTIKESSTTASNEFYQTSLPSSKVTSSSDLEDTTTVEFDQTMVEYYLRLSVESSWDNLCDVREDFKTALVNMLREGTKRNVTDRNVVFLNLDIAMCQSISSDTLELIPVNLYLVDENGDLDKNLSEAFLTIWGRDGLHFNLNICKVDFVMPLMTSTPVPTTSPAGLPGSVIAAIVISCIAGVCLVLFGIILLVMKRRQKKFNYVQRCRPVSLDAYSLDSVSIHNSVRRKGVRASKRSYGNPGFEDPNIPSHVMNFAGLANFSSDKEQLYEEFSLIPQVSPKSDELPPGAETKNRYANVIPLPETRIQLTKKEGDSLSDYINANYVRGPNRSSRLYIACQAPMDSTVEDFWRMIWEHQSRIILMLTELQENGVEKCADYLPPNEVTDSMRLFGDFQVTLKKRDVKEKYIISTLQLKNMETSLWREVIHMWYLGWPEQGVPSEANSLIAYLIEARSHLKTNNSGENPVVVHCSPGTGRTGTVIACDLCIKEFEKTRMVDIPRCVYNLRQDRAGAVQTKDQYSFIYQVLNVYATKLAGGNLESI